MATSLPLVFDPPRRAMPPRHFADLDEAGRAAAVAELGLPAFRGKQLANQYYGRLIADPHQMTDLPAAVRDQVADDDVPAAARRGAGDRVRRGRDPQDAVARGGRHHVRVGADALSAAQHRVHLVAGRLRDGVPVLRDGPGRAQAQPVDRGDSRAGACRGGGVARPRPRPAVQHRVHGHGRAAGQLQPGAGRGAPHHRGAAARVRHLGAFGHGVDGRAGARRSASWPTNGSASRSRCRCTRPTTSCATPWCRSTTGGRSPKHSTPQGITPTSPGGGSRSSTR